MFMDSSTGGSYVAEGDVMMLRKSHVPALPRLSVPQKTGLENGFRNDGASPSPMTFVSSLFADDPYPEKSFSHLLKDDSSDPNTTGITTGHVAPPMNPNHTARFKLAVPAKLSIRGSTCLTIPPGFSPTTLLDSPVLFSNTEVQLSPTTGACRLAPVLQDSRSVDSVDQNSNQSFAFKHSQLPLSPLSNSAHYGMSNQQNSIQMQTELNSQTNGYDTKQMLAPSSHGSTNPIQSQSHGQAHIESKTEPQNEPYEKVSNNTHQPLVISRPSEDGFNWRKYGQKQVKGSEFPRSYYKCTYPNCDVKKKVERSFDGQITEIVYKGEHTHPKPQSTRRSSSNLERADGSASRGGFGGTPEPSLGSVSEDDGEDGDANDCDDDDPESKRRRIESDLLASAPLRTVREPRVVVQTTSEVDILDDGYRWRKYGQKVVKGNAHPRSYYKCTNVGCSVRKQVERSSKDSKAVITTYEGKHNHDVPIARGGGHHELATTSSQPSDTNTSRPMALSLQEQMLNNNNFMGNIAPSNSGGLVSDHGNNASDMMVPNSSNGMKPFTPNEFFQRGFGFNVPKEEPTEVSMMGNSMHPMYKTNPFSTRMPS